MDLMIYLGLVAFAGVGLFSLMTQWEREGKSSRSVALVLGVALLEALVQRSATNVPLGIWRIPLGPLDLRPIDVLLPMALGARLIARPSFDYVSKVTGAWVLFLFWYFVVGYWGYVQGNDLGRLINQLRGMTLVVLTAVLVGGLRPSTAALERANRRLGKVAFFTALFVYGFRLTIGSTPFNVPLIGTPELGLISSEASLILACLGFYVLVQQMISQEQQILALAGSALLVLNPLLQTQAASIVALGAAVAALVGVAFTRAWRSRINVTGVQILLFAGAAVAVAIVGQLAVGEELGVVDGFEQALFSDVQGKTTEVRRILWADAVSLIRDSPFVGQGVGHLLEIPGRWPEESSQAASHNVTLDVALRSGLPGLLLFVAAIGITVATSWNRWFELEGVHAGALLAAFLTMVAILTKGQVESSLDAFRQATAFGAAIGIVVCYSKGDRGSNADEPEVSGLLETSSSPRR